MDQEKRNEQTSTHVVLTSGALVAQYRILERIGAGGMGEVFLAEDTKLKRKVALKFLPSHLAANPDIKIRFQREAQAVAKLNHPNIVTIHDVSEFNGRPYFVMEHIEGQSLHHFAHDEPLPIDTVIEYAIQICQGIGEAHRAGIVHRDIKTANIVIDTKGRARLLDFGLAAVAGDDKLTKTGSTLGTVSYMSPEQVSGRDIDQRSDLFSFGVVLYELIAGRTPFRRDNEGATLRAIIQDIPEPLSRYKSDIPPRLQSIIDKLLEKDKELRYQTAEDIIADLKRLIYDSQQTAHRQPARPKLSRVKLYIGAATVILLAVVAFFYLRPSAAQKVENSVPMVAVLPFENLGNPEDEYFADGMTEEITSRLAGINGLGVISRTSAMQYRNTTKSLGQIGKELGVDYILEGSVRWAKVGGQPKVRITPQLIRVSDDRHMWADNYEREMMEVFAVQEDIAAKIVDQLGLTLLESDRQVLATRPTANPRAYDFYLKGIAKLRRRDLDLPAMLDAAAPFDSAVRIDPSFALAHAARSRAYSLVAFASQVAEHRKIAREEFEKALQLEPKLALGHLAAGTYYNLVETDYDRALDEFNMAKSEMQNDADLLRNIALVQMRQGKFDEAADNYRKAAELDPLNPVAHYDLSLCLVFMRSYDEAEQAIDRAIALDPTRVDLQTQKLTIRVTEYGEWSKIEPVVREALAHVDTAGYLRYVWYFRRHMKDIPWETVLAQFRDRYRDKVELPQYYWAVGMGYDEIYGDKAMATRYVDSARMVLEKQLEENPTDPHHMSTLGWALSYLGSCDEAVQLGTRSKELLPVTKCHW